MELLAHNTLPDRLVALFRNARRDILIASPFVSTTAVNRTLDQFTPAFESTGRLTFLTDLSPRNVYQQATDPAALLKLSDRVPRTSIVHLPSLHAKVYLVDDSAAIITSANLTAGGLYRNYEYGVHVSEPNLVVQIRQDLDGYKELGATLDRQVLGDYCRVSNEVRKLYARKLAAASNRIAIQFEQKLQAAEDELIRLRLAGGAMHTVFGRTVRYLLKKHGPLSTKALHPMISAIHPDLCNDAVDRVIDGKSFGKKWKHAVRTAQQKLKKDGIIEFDGHHWRICGDVKTQ